MYPDRGAFGLKLNNDRPCVPPTQAVDQTPSEFSHCCCYRDWQRTRSTTQAGRDSRKLLVSRPQDVRPRLSNTANVLTAPSPNPPSTTRSAKAHGDRVGQTRTLRACKKQGGTCPPQAISNTLQAPDNLDLSPSSKVLNAAPGNCACTVGLCRFAQPNLHRSSPTI